MPDSNPFVTAKVDDLRRKAQDWRQKRQILRGGEVEQTRTPQPLWIDMKLYEIMMLYEIKILYQFISIMIWVDMSAVLCELDTARQEQSGFVGSHWSLFAISLHGGVISTRRGH